MAEVHPPIIVFNRGLISPIGLARTDLDRTQLSADIQTNWMPRTLGSMMLRPGMGYVGTVNNSSTAILVPFIRATRDTALLELTSTTVRVWVNDALVERDPTTSTFTLGNFSSTLLGGWTDADEAGTTSEYFGSTTVASASSDFMSLVGTRFARAIRRQTVASSSGNHAVRVAINRGRVNVRIGSSAGGDDYFNERLLRPGIYSLKITSTGDFDVEFSANTLYRSLVEQISVESSGPMKIDSTWVSSDLNLLRWDQSGDIIFVASGSTGRQKRIERYATESWAIADYEPDDGPFLPINISQTRLAPSALTGDITLEADHALFRSRHVGALWKITSAGQEVSVTVSASDQFSNPIRVAGVGGSRRFDILITAGSSFDATLLVQRSVGSTDDFANVSGLSFTTTKSTNHQDNLDNQIVYYRIGSGAYVSDTPVPSLKYDAGGLSGVVRINAVIASSQSSAAVLTDLGSTSATDLWEEGAWSDFRGYPSAVVFHENRLWWAGKARIWGSISDAFEGFDPEVEGDDGPINKFITSGPTDKIEWLQSLGTLIIGGQGREQHAKTNSLEAPLTPSNFNLRDISTQGSGGIQAIKIDTRTVFVQRSGVRVYEVGYSIDALTYENRDISALVPEIGDPEFVRMAVQRQPDTRVHFVRGSTDGTVGLLLSDKAENVLAWIDLETGAADGFNGRIEDVAILPSTGEDAVYYLVRRELNGSTQLHIERLALERNAQCLPAKSWVSLCVNADEGSTNPGSFVQSITVDGEERLGEPTYWTGDPKTFSKALAGNIINTGFDLETVFHSTDQRYNLTAPGGGDGGMSFKPDGTKFYWRTNESGGPDVYFQAELTRAWDLTSVKPVSTSRTFTLTASATADEIAILNWRPDGTRVFMTYSSDIFNGSSSENIHQFDVAVPWDIATVDTDSEITRDFRGAFAAEDPTVAQQIPRQLFFTPDGKQAILYVTGTATTVGDRFVTYDLAEPYAIDTAVFLETSPDIILKGTGSTARLHDEFSWTHFEFLPGGKTLWGSHFQSEVFSDFDYEPFYKFPLTKAYDVTTISPTTQSSTGTLEFVSESGPFGLGFNSSVGFLTKNTFQLDNFKFMPNGCGLFLFETVGDRVMRVDMACGTFGSPSSDDALGSVLSTAGVSSTSTIPKINRDPGSFDLLDSNCVIIESSSPGTCSSEEVRVIVQGGLTFTLSSRFLGNNSFCGAKLPHLFDAYGCQESSDPFTVVNTNADHLAGEVVGAWGDGMDLGFYKVSSTGTFTIPVAATAVCFGLTYEAWYKSVKLAYGSELGTALTQRKKVDHLGFILHCAHARGLRYGQTTSTGDLNDLPQIENGKLISPNSIWPAYDEETIEFPGEWDSDSRIILHAAAPRPCTVLGAIIEMETKE